MSLTLISPNWSLERRILRLRFLLAGLFAFCQLTGLLRIDWSIFWLLMLGGLALAGVIVAGIARRWTFLPTLNLLIDQLITVTLLSVSGGAASPYVFLIYLHVLSATVFLRQVSTVLVVGSVQVGILLLSTAIAALGSEAAWSPFVIHSLGLMLIAWTLSEPTRGLYRDAETDALTGALNRRAGLRGLQTWIMGGRPFNLLFADMKGFKHVNDTYGHSVGDAVLRNVAEALLNSVRGDDLVIRYGGDEFLVACRGDPEPVIRRLEATLSRPILTSRGEVRATVDLGTARYPHDGKNLNDLIHTADRQMFKRKRGARLTPLP